MQVLRRPTDYQYSRYTFSVTPGRGVHVLFVLTSTNAKGHDVQGSELSIRTVIHNPSVTPFYGSVCFIGP